MENDNTALPPSADEWRRQNPLAGVPPALGTWKVKDRTPPDVMDRLLGMYLRDVGMDAAARANRTWLLIAKIKAEDLALDHPERITTMDLVHAKLGADFPGRYVPIPDPNCIRLLTDPKKRWILPLGNAAGSVFRDPRWTRYKEDTSTRVVNHARISWWYKLASDLELAQYDELEGEKLLRAELRRLDRMAGKDVDL